MNDALLEEAARFTGFRGYWLIWLESWCYGVLSTTHCMGKAYKFSWNQCSNGVTRQGTKSSHQALKIFRCEQNFFFSSLLIVWKVLNSYVFCVPFFCMESLNTYFLLPKNILFLEV
ncbi:unnamed protein product, partial [Vitis vinifera]